MPTTPVITITASAPSEGNGGAVQLRMGDRTAIGLGGELKRLGGGGGLEPLFRTPGLQGQAANGAPFCAPPLFPW